MEEQIMNMPAVALRGLTILPGMIAHFDISRERSLRAVEEAMEQDQKIYLVTQRNVDSEDPTQEDLYQMGIVADIKQVVRLQNDVVRILVDGISRAALESPFPGLRSRSSILTLARMAKQERPARFS